MSRLAIAALALLLASHCCVAYDEGTTTLVDERRLSGPTTTADEESEGPTTTDDEESEETTTTSADADGTTTAAAFNTTVADGTTTDAAFNTTVADGTTTAAFNQPDAVVANGAVRASGIGPVLLALLAILCVGTGAGATPDETTATADERRLASA